MKDLLSGVSASGWGLFAGWIMPAAIAVVVVAYAILPAAPVALGEELERLGVAEQALVLGLAAVGVGLLLSAVQVPIYRILEGYTWPEALRQWAAARHRR